MERLSDGAIEEILAFRDQVEQKTENVSRSVEHDTNIMEDRSFIAFLDALNYTGFVETFDYTAWAGQRSQKKDMLENSAEELKNMDLEELRKLITIHLRIERFVEGHMQKLFKEGFFHAFFSRLEMLNDGSAE